MNYELIRSDRRTVALEVTRDGRVVVRAPRRMDIRRIDAFVEKHRDWLNTHLKKQQLWHLWPVLLIKHSVSFAKTSVQHILSVKW